MIPKVIHYCWFGGGPKNELIEKCIASWKRFCPDYEVIEWNESNYDVLSHPFMKKAFENRKWAFVSDYARIDLLYRLGGVYLDTDVELLKSLDSFMDLDFFAGFENEKYVAFGLGVGSVAGHPVLRDLLDAYDRLELSDHFFDVTTCPQLQTEALVKRGLVCNNRTQVVDGCHVFSSDYFCPMSYYTGKTEITENTVSIHHYDMSWLLESYRKSRHREWKMMRVFGPRAGKLINSAVSLPGKLLTHIRNGDLKEYFRFVAERVRKKRT